MLLNYPAYLDIVRGSETLRASFAGLGIIDVRVDEDVTRIFPSDRRIITF